MTKSTKRKKENGTDSVMRVKSSIKNENKKIIKFGQYKYDREKSKKIVWRVLKIEQNRALLITESCIAQAEYNKSHVKVTWKECWLREWLNKDFFNKAFSDEEKSMICDINLSNGENKQSGRESMIDDPDKVFILSTEEAENYFQSEFDRKAKPTPFANAEGVHKDKNGYSWWWLRTPGARGECTCTVFKNGAINYVGYNVDMEVVGVRPAIWVDIT